LQEGGLGGCCGLWCHHGGPHLFRQEYTSADTVSGTRRCLLRRSSLGRGGIPPVRRPLGWTTPSGAAILQGRGNRHARHAEIGGSCRAPAPRNSRLLPPLRTP